MAGVLRPLAALWIISMSLLRPLSVFSYHVGSKRTSRSPLRLFLPRIALFSPRRLSSLAVSTDSSLSDIIVPKNFVPYPFHYRQDLTARVSSLTNLGMGVCRVKVPPSEEEDKQNDKEESRDWVVFVPNVIPGELITLRVYRNYKTYSDADLVEIIEPSSDRVEPVCPLSDTCGGCQYQHMSITAQRDWKSSQVRDVLQRIGGIDDPIVSDTVGTEHVWHYRSKITPHYEAPRKSNGAYEIDQIGFKVKSSRKLVDVPYCHIATEAINEKLTELRAETHDNAKTNQLRRPKRGATLLLRDADQGVVTDPTTYVTTTVSGLKFRFMAGNFFQNNPHMVPVMVHHVVEAAKKPNRAGQPMTHLIDCYCGSGLFCLSAASSFDVCVGIEVNDKAVEEAYANAELNSIENCRFVAASAEAIFKGKHDDESLSDVESFPRDQTVVVVDPPRKGCSEEFLEQLYEYAPQRVVYMSCDPSTQARDAKGLLANGYDMVSVQPFDLFPQTRHIECLVVFERSKGDMVMGAK